MSSPTHIKIADSIETLCGESLDAPTIHFVDIQSYLNHLAFTPESLTNTCKDCAKKVGIEIQKVVALYKKIQSVHDA